MTNLAKEAVNVTLIINLRSMERRTGMNWIQTNSDASYHTDCQCFGGDESPQKKPSKCRSHMTNGPAMVQRHFKVLAEYALSFPRLVEPNPSCEPFGM